MFRVVTYNIRAGLGSDNVRSIGRVADLLTSLAPDIVCLQEVDQLMPRSGLANQPKYLGTRLGMYPVFQRNINYGVGGYGNCVLSKPQVLSCRRHPLPATGEPRGVLEVTTLVGGQEITVFCTHLGLDADERVTQGRKAREIVHGVHAPKILCGDMNDVADSPTLSALLQGGALRDVAPEVNAAHIPTFPGLEARIDFILADLGFDLRSYQVAQSDASDHFPVVADLAWA